MSASASVGVATPPEVGKPLRRKLRVLTLTPFYPSQQNPSEGCFVSEVLPWTQQLKLENEVIAVRPFYRGKARLVDSEIPSGCIKYFSVPGNLGLASAGSFLASTLTRFLHGARSESVFDLIHAHGALPCGHAASIVSDRFGIPFVVTVHGLDVFSDRQVTGILGVWCHRVSEQVYRQARAVICISEAVQQRMGDIAGNTSVVYNAVDAGLFSPGPETSSPIILSVGNLIPTKGHALLLRAFARIAPHVCDCELQIIGDGPERQALVGLSQRLGIRNRVKFLGRRDRPAVAQAMKCCSIFALPSSYEGFGCVYVEAMACGKPVIGCEGQGIAQIIQHGENGLLVAPEDEPQLSSALLMLLQSSDLRARLGSAARNTVLQRHTLAHQAGELTQLYRECVA